MLSPKQFCINLLCALGYNDSGPPDLCGVLFSGGEVISDMVASLFQGVRTRSYTIVCLDRSFKRQKFSH